MNKQLEEERQATLAQELQEAAMLEGPTRAVALSEEETLLADEQKRTGLDQVIQELKGLPDSTLSQISQHIDEIRRRTPSLASPTKSPAPPPRLESMPQNSSITQQIMQATTILGQLPSGDCPVTTPPGEVETKIATDIIEAQMKAPGTPIR